jgi:hypothetical protein
MAQKHIVALFSFFLFPLIYCTSAFSQYGDRTLVEGDQRLFKQDSYFSKPLRLVDYPTASILRGGDMQIGLRLQEDGGALASINVGISRYFMLGVSYGGAGIIGNQDIRWNAMPGVQLAYRLLEEDLKLPALVIGFDSQGFGDWWPTRDKKDNNYAKEDSLLHNRYSIKSRGFYAVISKAFDPSLIRVGLHGGLSYSLEGRKEDDVYADSDPTVFIGMDAQVSKDVATIFEFDFGTNDDKLNKGKGFFNVALRWAFMDCMVLEFDFKNILGTLVVAPNGQILADRSRTIQISYTSRIY